jgi:hypothetical protein
MNKFQIWINFGFEQFWIWKKTDLNKFLDLNEFQIWTNFWFEKIQNFKQLQIWENF